MPMVTRRKKLRRSGRPGADPGVVSQAVGRLLKGYAERGVFRSFSAGQRRGGTTRYQMVWHHGRPFRFVLDTTAGLVSFPTLLPEVPSRSPMQRELKAFLGAFETDDVPVHRRIDPAKGQLRITRRAGGLAVGLVVKNGEFEYCTRRLVHLAQEVFLVFLPDGPYYEYRVEKLGLDPNVAWA
jgi:hypothetical protein